MAKKVKKSELGLGIRALLSDIEGGDGVQKETAFKELTNTVAMLPLSQISINPFQPRKEFNPDAIQELSDSIKVHGLIQPITVRSLGGDSYQLISGERRMRASNLAGLEAIPAYIRAAANDQEMLELALIENIQRQDLNPIEISITYQRLIDECKLTHEGLSGRVGKKRSTITNFLGLLKLPPQIQQGLKDKKISMGHAKALNAIQDYAVQISLFNEIVDKQLSVRATEDFVRQINNPNSNGKNGSKKKSLPVEYQDVQNRISSALESRVNLKLKSKGKGQIIINFTSDNELNRLLDIFEEGI
jgi:ParB family chromosome partitioning protein